MCRYLSAGSEEAADRPLLVVPGEGTRGDEHKLKCEIPSEHKKTHFYCEGNETLERSAQRDVEISSAKPCKPDCTWS